MRPMLSGGLGEVEAEFCALVEHEPYHLAQELDEFGAPKFTKDG